MSTLQLTLKLESSLVWEATTCSAGLYGIISQKRVFFIVAAVSTSKETDLISYISLQYP